MNGSRVNDRRRGYMNDAPFLAFIVAVYDAIKVRGNFPTHATFFERALFLLRVCTVKLIVLACFKLVSCMEW